MFEYSKSYEKGKSKGKKGKGKGQGKEERPPPNSSFAGHCRLCGKWGHRANECWQGYVQGMEEAPSSSSSSTVRSAVVTTSAAAKTAAVIQEVDEDESGWIFGVVGRSGTAATTDRDEDLGRVGSGQWIGVNGLSVRMVCGQNA